MVGCIWMLCYWHKVGNRRERNDGEVFEQALQTYLRLVKDHRHVKKRDELIYDLSKAKYDGCRYSKIDMEFFKPIKYGYW